MVGIFHDWRESVLSETGETISGQSDDNTETS